MGEKTKGSPDNESADSDDVPKGNQVVNEEKSKETKVEPSVGYEPWMIIKRKPRKKVKEGQKCPHKQEKALPSNPRTQRQNNNWVKFKGR